MSDDRVYVEFEPDEDGGVEWNVYVDANGDAFPDQRAAERRLLEQRRTS